MFRPSDCILDQGQVIKYFCRISLVTYLVYYNYSNAGPEYQAMLIAFVSSHFQNKSIQQVSVIRYTQAVKVKISLVIYVYLSSLPVAHLSNAPQKTVSCHGG